MTATRTIGIATGTSLILRSRAQRGVSKDGRGARASWFETRRFAALLTMRGGLEGRV